MFSDDEIGFLRAAAPALGEGARRALLLGEARDPEGPDAPGLLVLSAQLGGRVLHARASSAGCPTCPAATGTPAGCPPPCSRSPGARCARRRAATRPARWRSRACCRESGTWVVLHGATLVGDGPPRVAVIVEPAHPARITPLLMSAYGLTEREQEVTRLVLQGDSTAADRRAAVVSPHTVQQHLKNVFEKTGVRSRRDLVGKVFFSHYEPRLRDNEQRALDGRPLRGGPVD